MDVGEKRSFLHVFQDAFTGRRAFRYNASMFAQRRLHHLGAALIAFLTRYIPCSTDDATLFAQVWSSFGVSPIF